MKLVTSKKSLPCPRFTAEQIKFNKNKFNDYPYLILALLDKVPQLRKFSDESITLYHHSVREILISKYITGKPKKKDTLLLI